MEAIPDLRLKGIVLESTGRDILSKTAPGPDRAGFHQSERVLIRDDKDQLSESDLVRMSLAGDGQAYEIIVRRYQKLVYNVLYQMVGSHEIACDLTQDTYLKAFKALSTFRLEARFKPWLLRIATNAGLNWIRDNKKEESLEAMLEDNPQAEPAGRQDVCEEVEWLMTQAMLLDALRQLPARHRHVFVLRYQHDLPYEDIAEVTGESVTTIKSLLFRTRERLRKMLSEKMRA